MCPGLRLHRQLSTCNKNLSKVILKSRVADPHYFKADQDLDTAFHSKADPYPALHFNADPDPAAHQNDAYLLPLVYRTSTAF